MAKQKNLTGQKFGSLTVLSRRREKHPSGNYRYLATCKCDCGIIKDIDVSHLKTGRTKSCGCNKNYYENMLGEKSPCFKGYKEIRGKTWSLLKRRSGCRGHSFNLDIKDAWNLFEKQERKCALTGLPILFSKCNGETTASLDRIDNSKGYDIDNIQWVHKDVNIMRNVYSIEYFIKICKLVSAIH